MIMGLSAFANIILSNAIPSKSTFNELKIQSTNFDISVDEMKLTINTQLTPIDISIPSTWDYNDTLLLADFNNRYTNSNANLQAGSFKDNEIPLISYDLYKKEDSKYEYKFLTTGTVINSLTNAQYSGGEPYGDYYSYDSVIDYMARNRTKYNYLRKNNDADGEAGYTLATPTLDFFGWFLINKNQNTVYKFDLDFESQDMVINDDFTIFESYTQKPITKKINRNYRSGQLKTMPYTIINNEEIINKSILQVIEDFITNTEYKYLKNTSGEIMKVMTYNFSYKYMDSIFAEMNGRNEQPFTISFDFVEIGEV